MVEGKKRKQEIILLIISLFVVLLLALGHAYNNLILLSCALLGFLISVIFSKKDNFLPLMLFYLPWSPVLRLNPNNNSFCSLVIPIIFLMVFLSWIRKETDIKKEYFALAFLITSYTLIVKLLNGLPLHKPYLLFILMLFFVPIYLIEYKENISFENCVIFLAAGILSACIAAGLLINNPNLSQYITVNIYIEKDYSLFRLSGFYGDPNYFSAQILVAIASLLIVLGNTQRKALIVLEIASIIVLLYFGMQSVSRMFLLGAGVLTILWVINFLKEKHGFIYKSGIIVVIAISMGLIVSNKLFLEQINFYLMRFGSVSNNMSSFTTGRSDHWITYLNYVFSNFDKLLFGIGLSEDQIVKVLKSNNAHLTFIEMIYQLGITGTILLLWWWKSIYFELVKRTKINTSKWTYLLIMGTSVFLPWLVLDMLYFDEFFYLTILFFLSKNYLSERTKLNYAIKPER